MTSLQAELFAAEFWAMYRAADEFGTAQDSFCALIDEAGQVGGRLALAMTRTMSAIGPQAVQDRAAAVSNLLVTTGVKDFPWARNLGQPQWVNGFGYEIPEEGQRTIALEFRYRSRSHAVVILIDDYLGGGIKDCWVTDSVSTVRAGHRHAAMSVGVPFREYSAAESLTIVSEALENPPCPAQDDQIRDVVMFLPLLFSRTVHLGTLVDPADLLALPPLPDRPAAQAQAATNTVHRLKVTIAGSKPPIWRRLEVPSGTSLSDLHHILQTAFGWDNSHLWSMRVGEQEYGNGGEHRARASGTILGRVAPVGSKFIYLYDFGDGWEHTIVVESVEEADPGVVYPRCVAGRRAGPVEDSGGIWGYEAMILRLADPADPEHQDTLEWLGLDAPEEFDPAAFDRVALNKHLARYATR